MSYNLPPGVGVDDIPGWNDRWIECEECGAEYNDKCERCPECGAPNYREEE